MAELDLAADVSLLDVPRETPPADADAYLRAAIAWHFGADTGSPFWLTAANGLGFDPLTDVRTFTDLRLFPNLTDQLRSVPVEDLIPRGYGTPLPIPRIYESGGTTGAPKRTAQLPDWVEQVTRWQVEDFTAGGFVPGGGLLCMMPSGPARRWIGPINPQAPSGRAGARCSPSTRPATHRACTACGRRPSHWATGWPSGRPGGNRSPPTGSSSPCATPVSATRMRCSCRPTTPWCTAARPLRAATPPTRRCW